MRRLDSRSAEFPEQVGRLIYSLPDTEPGVVDAVRAILEDVRVRGDAALVEYTNRFDARGIAAADLEVPPQRMEEALTGIDAGIRDALEEAADRIRTYHGYQRLESWSFEDAGGNELGQKISALDRVGIYVPGGTAAYPSTVLMNTIPAKLAGVEEIIMVVPAPGGELNPGVLAAAHIAGVDRVFSIGGAQAVAALAYGTATVPAVDKIVGPGNRYVAAAKRMVFGVVGIDMIAGPSEVVIVTDDSSDPDWLAMDLFAQAEHDEDARPILISTDAAVSDAVEASIARMLPDLERSQIIAAALAQNGAIIDVPDTETAAGIVNRLAPEHLELSVADPDELLKRIRHAGAIFLGRHAAEVIGDYCGGPNHVLPTGRTARFFSPLGVYDFQKRSSVIRCTPQSASSLARVAAVLARAEGLTAHARSAELRMTRR